MANSDDHREEMKALQGRVHDLTQLIDSIPAIVIVLSPSGEVEHANQQAMNYFGIVLDEVTRRFNQELIHPHDVERTAQVFADAISSGKPCELEHRLKRADGVTRWFQTRAQPMRGATGAIEHWYMLLTDIDERKQLEDQLRARELSVRLLVESMESIPAYAIVSNEVGEIVFANRQVLNYYGRTLEQVKAWPTSAHIVHPDDLDAANQVVANSLKAGVAYNDEYRLQRHDGVYRWFEGRGLPVRDESGRVINWYVLLIDIDDRKRAESVLAAENRMLESVARGASLLTVLDGLCRAVESLDPCICSIHLVDATGKKLEHGSGPSLRPTFTAALNDAPIGPDYGPCCLAASNNERVIVPDIDTDPRWRGDGFKTPTLREGFRSMWSTPILSRSRDVLGTFAIYRTEIGAPTEFQLDLVAQFAHIASIAIERAQDDGAMVKVRSELAHVARVTSLSALTASIAHEVNQPLSGILTNANTSLMMLGADPPNVDGARETARRTIRDANRASAVITRLRSLFSKKPAVIEPVNLNEAAQDVIALSQHELDQNRIAVRTEFESKLPQVDGDRVQIQQVILNLLLNAGDALAAVEDRPRQIVVRTTLDEAGDARLTVRDNGSGIDPQIAGRLFESFYSTKSSGMGIGLSISRSIIERHGGRLWLEQSEGPGAAFSFSIPLPETAEQSD